MEMKKETTSKTSKDRHNILIVTVVMFVFIVGFAKFQDTGFLFGYRTTFVLSGSMEPEIPIATLLVEKKYDMKEAVDVGDIITFSIIDNNTKKRITHRVYAISNNNIYTKGDANLNVDSWTISKKDIESKVIYIYPYFLQTITLITIVILSIIQLKKRKL